MNIRPKIPMYLGGSTLDLDKWILENLNYYNWYSKLYPNALILQGNPLKQRNDNWDKNRLSSSHYTTDDLRRSAYNNYLYTKDYDARLRDLIYWSEQLKGLDKLSDLQIVDLYNTLALSIRDAREAPQTYNKTGYSGTNQTFRNMFYNRSMQGTNTPDYNIGYLENLDNIEGTSTWQRRMDRYENPFDKDTLEGQQNRTFYINVPGTNRLVKVYKKENGDIGLFPNNPSIQQQGTPRTDPSKTGGGIPVGQKADPESIWNKLGAGLKNVAPDLLDALRLAGNMHNNERVYNESMKAIIPNLLQTYHTHRQVVGDEATKLAYYRRAALGETRAALPFTSDADRQIAYMNEAKRVGDELRAQGDLTDNQRIRETSAESAAHADANTERDTAVANSNLTELIKAKAAKHQLTALKYSADWTNLEQYLMGRLYKLELKKAELKELERQLTLLNALEKLIGDTTLRDLKTAYDEAYDAYYNEKDPTKKAALKLKYEKIANDYLLYSIKKKREALKLQYGKEGTKIERKHKDDSSKYLYRTSRDIVEHFRKMSKMTDNSRIKTLPKPIKLTSHPKKRKYLLGGVAPFTIYRPLGVGGETTTLVASSTEGAKSSKDTAAKDKLDMIKEMFKAVQNTGLPVDVNVVYRDLNNLFSRAQAFGEELSSDDIASIYLQSMQKISNLKYSKENYDKALAVATSNESLNELAVDALGHYVVQDKDSKLSLVKSLEEAREKGLNPITNQLLLNLRAYSPDLAFLRGDATVINIINNGMGINKIGSLIQALAGSLGSTEGKLEGISLVESGKVKAGLLLLAGTKGTPDGHYSVTNYTKDLLNQVLAALKYIENMLSPSLKAILEAHGGTKLNIALFLTSQLDYVNEQTISPLTGKASKDDKSSKISPAVALSMGLGERESFVIADKTADGLKVSAVSLPLLDHNHNAMAVATLLLVGSGDYAGQLLLNNATMGGIKISPEGVNNVLVSEGRIHAAELPIDKNAASLGIIKPDLNFLKNIEKADEQIRAAGITNRDKLTIELVKTINDIYNKNGLPMIYSMSSNGPVLTSDYRRFAMVHATATLDAFEEDLSFNDGAIEASEDDRKRFEALMKLVTGNAKYSLDNGISIPGIGRITGTDLYKGIVYIPMSESHISALSSTGYTASPEEYNLIDALDLQAEFIKTSGYQNAGGWTQ